MFSIHNFKTASLCQTTRKSSEVNFALCSCHVLIVMCCQNVSKNDFVHQRKQLNFDPSQNHYPMTGQHGVLYTIHWRAFVESNLANICSTRTDRQTGEIQRSHFIFMFACFSRDCLRKHFDLFSKYVHQKTRPPQRKCVSKYKLD